MLDFVPEFDWDTLGDALPEAMEQSLNHLNAKLKNLLVVRPTAELFFSLSETLANKNFDYSNDAELQQLTQANPADIEESLVSLIAQRFGLSVNLADLETGAYDSEISLLLLEKNDPGLFSQAMSAFAQLTGIEPSNSSLEDFYTAGLRNKLQALRSGNISALAEFISSVGGLFDVKRISGQLANGLMASYDNIAAIPQGILGTTVNPGDEKVALVEQLNARLGLALVPSQFSVTESSFAIYLLSLSQNDIDSIRNVFEILSGTDTANWGELLNSDVLAQLRQASPVLQFQSLLGKAFTVSYDDAESVDAAIFETSQYQIELKTILMERLNEVFGYNSTKLKELFINDELFDTAVKELSIEQQENVLAIFRQLENNDVNDSWVDIVNNHSLKAMLDSLESDENYLADIKSYFTQQSISLDDATAELIEHVVKSSLNVVEFSIYDRTLDVAIVGLDTASRNSILDDFRSLSHITADATWSSILINNRFAPIIEHLGEDSEHLVNISKYFAHHGGSISADNAQLVKNIIESNYSIGSISLDRFDIDGVSLNEMALEKTLETLFNFTTDNFDVAQNSLEVHLLSLSESELTNIMSAFASLTGLVLDSPQDLGAILNSDLRTTFFQYSQIPSMLQKTASVEDFNKISISSTSAKELLKVQLITQINTAFEFTLSPQDFSLDSSYDKSSMAEAILLQYINNTLNAELTDFDIERHSFELSLASHLSDTTFKDILRSISGLESDADFTQEKITSLENELKDHTSAEALVAAYANSFTGTEEENLQRAEKILDMTYLEFKLEDLFTSEASSSFLEKVISEELNQRFGLSLDIEKEIDLATNGIALSLAQLPQVQAEQYLQVFRQLNGDVEMDDSLATLLDEGLLTKLNSVNGTGDAIKGLLANYDFSLEESLGALSFKAHFDAASQEFVIDVGIDQTFNKTLADFSASDLEGTLNKALDELKSNGAFSELLGQINQSSVDLSSLNLSLPESLQQVKLMLAASGQIEMRLDMSKVISGNPAEFNATEDISLQLKQFEVKASSQLDNIDWSITELPGIDLQIQNGSFALNAALSGSSAKLTLAQLATADLDMKSTAELNLTLPLQISLDSNQVSTPDFGPLTEQINALADAVKNPVISLQTDLLGASPLTDITVDYDISALGESFISLFSSLESIGPNSLFNSNSETTEDSFFSGIKKTLEAYFDVMKVYSFDLNSLSGDTVEFSLDKAEHQRALAQRLNDVYATGIDISKFDTAVVANQPADFDFRTYLPEIVMMGSLFVEDTEISIESPFAGTSHDLLKSFSAFFGLELNSFAQLRSIMAQYTSRTESVVDIEAVNEIQLLRVNTIKQESLPIDSSLTVETDGSVVQSAVYSLDIIGPLLASTAEALTDDSEASYERQRIEYNITKGPKSYAYYNLNLGDKSERVKFTFNDKNTNLTRLQNALDVLISDGSATVFFDNDSTNANPAYVIHFNSNASTPLLQAELETEGDYVFGSGASIDIYANAVKVDSQQIAVDRDLNSPFTLSLTHAGQLYVTVELAADASADVIKTALNNAFTGIATFAVTGENDDIFKIDITPLGDSLDLFTVNYTQAPSFTLSYGSSETAAITFSSDSSTMAANIQQALNNLPEIPDGSITVSYNQTYHVEFAGSLAGTALETLTVNSDYLSVLSSQTQQSQAAVNEVQKLSIDTSGKGSLKLS
ncbi:MAG: hypothetical protein HRT88_09640, partial [Lentisphaeraceae bacterium]|nr:hypothetical protein [Lentisphaeraceae bacterium]